MGTKAQLGFVQTMVANAFDLRRGKGDSWMFVSHPMCVGDWHGWGGGWDHKGKSKCRGDSDGTDGRRRISIESSQFETFDFGDSLPDSFPLSSETLHPFS